MTITGAAGSNTSKRRSTQSGKIVAWKDHFVAYGEGEAFVHDGGFNASEFPGDYVENFLVQASTMPLGLKTGALRAPGSNSMAWVIQSFLDELANAAGQDPVQFRLDLLKHRLPPKSGAAPTTAPRRGPGGQQVLGFSASRAASAIQLAAEKSGWGKRELPKGTELGFAFHVCMGGYFAEVAEVSLVASKKLKVNKVWSRATSVARSLTQVAPKTKCMVRSSMDSAK